MQGHTGTVWTLVCTNDFEYIVTGSRDTTVRIWSIRENRQESVLHGHTSHVRSLAITRNNKYIISASDDETVRVWILKSWRSNGISMGNKNNDTN